MRPRYASSASRRTEPPAAARCRFAMTTSRRPLAELRSQRWFAADTIRAFAHRQRMQQTGLRRDDFLGKPVIAIVNTWSDLSTCHAHLRERAEAVKRGVWQAGGVPVELPALSLGEVVVKPTTMLYRNLLALETEELLRSHPVDGAVLLGGCDKTTPGLLMGAISMDLPAIYCPAGPMSTGFWRGAKTGAGTHTKKYWDELRLGRITPADWIELEGRMTRTAGTCNTMGTASTMTSIADALGFTLPGASSIPAVDSGHAQMAADCGERAVAMVWEGLTPSRLLTRASFDNAMVAYMALGGSTNAAVHLIALARRARVPLALADMDARRARHAGARQPVPERRRPDGRLLVRRRPARIAVAAARRAGARRADRQRPHAGREPRRRPGVERRRDPPAGAPGHRRPGHARCVGRAHWQPRAARRRHQAFGGDAGAARRTAGRRWCSTTTPSSRRASTTRTCR